MQYIIDGATRLDYSSNKARHTLTKVDLILTHAAQDATTAMKEEQTR